MRNVCLVPANRLAAGGRWRETEHVPTTIPAAAAAGADMVRAWLAEEPDSVPAAAMRARAAGERALRAHRDQAEPAEGIV
jgi:hypothetical protein